MIYPNMLHFLPWGIISPSLYYKLENHSLSAVRDCLFNVFAAALPIRGCIQKFPDWPPGTRTANGPALCH